MLYYIIKYYIILILYYILLYSLYLIVLDVDNKLWRNWMNVHMNICCVWYIWFMHKHTHTHMHIYIYDIYIYVYAQIHIEMNSTFAAFLEVQSLRQNHGLVWGRARKPGSQAPRLMQTWWNRSPRESSGNQRNNIPKIDEIQRNPNIFLRCDQWKSSKMRDMQKQMFFNWNMFLGCWNLAKTLQIVDGMAG